MSAFTDADSAYMALALALAERGLYTTTPNPRVGCVIVADSSVIGEGWHEWAGSPHAEANALADAAGRGYSVRGATMYVTLEPCNHTGRTPPCADAVVAAGIGRVVAAMADPNPGSASGAARLRAAGIPVDIGLRGDEAREQNIGFVSRMTRGRPWVRIKAAASLDGRTALSTGESKWITGEAARADAHRWRARACAILTGHGTIHHDDPQLTVRAIAVPRQPRRIVIDRHAETPPEARVLADDNVLMVTAGARNPAWRSAIPHLALPDANGRIDLRALMNALGERGINELHVEAGARLNGALLDAGLADELLLYLTPSIIGDPALGVAAFRTGLANLSDRIELDMRDVTQVGADLRILARVAKRAR